AIIVEHILHTRKVGTNRGNHQSHFSYRRHQRLYRSHAAPVAIAGTGNCYWLVIVGFQLAVQKTLKTAGKTVIILWCNYKEAVCFLGDGGVFGILAFWVIPVTRQRKILGVNKNDLHPQLFAKLCHILCGMDRLTSDSGSPSNNGDN